MYQFPDSSEVMGYQEPEPLNKGSRYKIIIIANLLLALFIIAVIWFFFFFDSKPRNAVALNQSLITKSVYLDTQHSTGDYTPIITNDADPAPVIPSAENNNIPIIATTQNNKGKEKQSAVDIITNELKKNQLLKKPRAITVNNNKTATPPTLSKVATNKEKPLSLKSDITLALNTVEDSYSTKEATDKTKKNTTVQSLSAVDLITNELMKNKDEKSGRNQSNNNIILSNNSTLKQETTNKIALAEQVEKKHLKKNQVVIKHPTEQPLARKIAKISQNLDDANQQFIKKLVEIDKPQQVSTDATKTAQHKSRNTATYNSISLKKESDIDKIMLAMGSIKKPVDEKTADKIDSTVKKLLKNAANKSKNTDLYVEKLQPESEENKKEIRTITVKQGEKLWDIAVRAYGDGNKYKILLEANPMLKNNPKLIKAGITLRAPL